MAEDDAEKTEQPSGKRLDEAREKGDIPQSQEVRLWASLLSAFIIIAILPGRIAHAVATTVLPLIEHPHTYSLTPEELQILVVQLGSGIGLALAWPFAVVIAITLISLVGQTKGFMWVPDKLMPDFNRLNPMAGLQRLVSPQHLIDFLKQLTKIVVVGAILGWIIWSRVGEYAQLGQLSLMGILDYLHRRVYALVLVVLLLATVLTVADYAFQYWRYIQKMKMTKQELRDEHKQQEGDPMVKMRVRTLRAKRARQRMMQAVPNADVVVTNPTHFAVALKYDMEEMNAPVLVAKGGDLVAQRIRELAEENEVPIVENPPLARALFATVELDQEVPPEHYKAVAEVISYVMRLKGKIAE